MRDQAIALLLLLVGIVMVARVELLLLLLLLRVVMIAMWLLLLLKEGLLLRGIARETIQPCLATMMLMMLLRCRPIDVVVLVLASERGR